MGKTLHSTTGKPALELIKRLLKEAVKPYWPWIAGALVCMAAAAAATGVTAWLMDPVVNRIFVDKDHDYLIPVAAAVLSAFIVKGLAGYGQAVLVGRLGQRVIADMQQKLFDHVVSLDIAFFQSTSTGTILSRMTNDIAMMRVAVSTALTGFGKDALTLIFLIGVTFYQDWLLATVSFFVFPLAFLPIIRLGKRMRRVTADTQEQMGQFSTLLEQTIQGIRIVKAYGMEDYERAKANTILETIYRLVCKANRVRSASSPIMESLGGIAVTVVVLYGGARVIDGETSAGAFFSFITALMMAYQPLKSLSNLTTNLQEGLAAAERTFQLLDMKSAIVEKSDATPLTVESGEIRFEDVSFSYDGRKRALDSLSLRVESGKTIALVGPSGAGKTTILNMIARFYDAAAGRILIDGQDIRSVSLESLYKHIALVSQDITLFDDTIRANIRHGRMDATDDEVMDAARHAAAHDFIEALPQGYDTMVGERGMALSGGQRQRLAIARAMLRDAPILLLDEATSALDAQSERLVQTALDRLMKNRTTLVIAHRLSTVIHADLICVIDHGRVIEKGTHAELLAMNGAYARLYNLQFAKDHSGAV